MSNHAYKQSYLDSVDGPGPYAGIAAGADNSLVVLPSHTCDTTRVSVLRVHQSQHTRKSRERSTYLDRNFLE